MVHPFGLLRSSVDFHLTHLVDLALFLYAYYHSHRHIFRHYHVEWELDLTGGRTGGVWSRMRSICNSALGTGPTYANCFQAQHRTYSAPIHPEFPAIYSNLLGIALPSLTGSLVLVHLG